VPQDLMPEKAHPEAPIPRRKPRTARPLKPAQIDALIAGYRTGKTMKAHLRRASVIPRRGGLDQGRAAEATRLYEAGWSSGRLAKRFNVSADNVLKALRGAGVTIRPRRGGRRADRP
jgi:hypothetical protein